MNMPTKFELNPISSLSVDVQKVSYQSESRNLNSGNPVELDQK